MLRMYGPDVYDDWVAHRIPFNDERVVKAFDEFAKIAKTPGQVLGGTRGILNTAFGEAMTPAFDEPAEVHACSGRATSSSRFLPRRCAEGPRRSRSGSSSSRRSKAATPGSRSWVAVTRRRCSTATTTTLKPVDGVPHAPTSSVTSGRKAGGWLSPHTTFDASNYPNETTQAMAKIAADADVFRFDGSDLMPKAVGSGTFWTEMVKWQNGQSSQATADAIESVLAEVMSVTDDERGSPLDRTGSRFPTPQTCRDDCSR